MEGSSSNRGELIRNAVLFLNDPKVQSSSLTSRITFLESKGLNEAEIQQALQEASRPSPQPFATPFEYGYGRMTAPEPPKRDWRDLFIMAVVSGGVIYGVATLAQKYLMPHLQPPSSTSFQQTSTSLTAQYDEAAALLTALQDQTTKLEERIEGDRERVNGVVGEVEQAIKGVKEGEERWREEMREMREEVETLKELVPRMIEKHATGQSASLTDLKSELKSLKTLLTSRLQAPPSSPSGNNGSSGVSSTTTAANALLGIRGGKGIPAWQLGPGGNRSPGSSGGNSLSGSGILEKEEEGKKVEE